VGLTSRATALENRHLAPELAFSTGDFEKRLGALIANLNTIKHLDLREVDSKLKRENEFTGVLAKIPDFANSLIDGDSQKF
jgi:hypothetical protein